MEIAGQSGTVQTIDITYTKLTTGDNKTISIPNSAVVASQIVNYSTSGTRRVERGWAQTGIITFIIALVALAVYFFNKRIVLKKIGFISAIAFLFFCILANIFASTQKADLQNHSNAIIMAPSITVKSTPNDNGTELFILHEGRKVIIKDNTMKEWKEIQLEDGNAGWVPAQAIEII